jgi:hypothetical protein
MNAGALDRRLIEVIFLGPMIEIYETRLLKVYRRKDGSEFVVLPTRSNYLRRQRFTLDAPNLIVFTAMERQS